MSGQSTDGVMSLPIFERDVTLTPAKIRSIGLIPATIYGKGFEPMSIQIQAHEFHLALAKGIKQFRLEGCGKIIDASVHQLQKVSTKEQVLHIEFLVPSAEGSGKSAKAAKAKSKPEPVAV